MKKCENCEEEHDENYASGRFCSSLCAKSFSTKKNRKEINAKISEKMKKPYIERNCEICGIPFLTRPNYRKTCCSLSCKAKKYTSSQEVKDKLSKHFREIAKRRYESNDLTIGWQSRKKMKRSGPELEAIEIFKEFEISNYEMEHKVGKYFLDFAFLDLKLDIEIDGKQHQYEEIKLKDKRRDSYLSENGWKIVRIDWPKNKNLLKEEIQKMMGVRSSP